MPTVRKQEAVAELRELIERSSIVISAEYRGLNVKEMTALRRALRESGVEVRVVKNRLFQLAVEQAGAGDAGNVVEGPTLIIFGYGDVVAPAKAVTEYARTARNAFAPKKAYTQGVVLEGAAIGELASMPSREELIAQLAGALAAPMRNLVNLLDRAMGNPAGILLNDSLRTLQGLLDARAKQLRAA